MVLDMVDKDLLYYVLIIKANIAQKCQILPKKLNLAFLLNIFSDLKPQKYSILKDGGKNTRRGRVPQFCCREGHKNLTPPEDTQYQYLPL